MTDYKRQLISYIAPAAPATRRPADGDETFLRPEVGFTPKWYHDALGIDFGERWHTDPLYRRDTVVAMRDELRRRFPGTRVGNTNLPDKPLDLVTGTFGGSFMASVFGVPIIYAEDNWPNSAHKYLSDEEMATIEPPDLEKNEFFQGFMAQLDTIAESEGQIIGFINPQGILNTSQRLRGEMLFMDMMESPDACRNLFDAVCETMIRVVDAVRERQRESGVDYTFFTVSNCLVNMVSGRMYEELLLPYDLRISERYDILGIHNCAWNATPYIDSYAQVKNLAYMDMGHDSDMERAKAAFPHARRAIMYTPMDVANKSLEEIRTDFTRIAEQYGPCDLVLADIETDTPDERVNAVIEICDDLSREYGDS